MTPTLGDAGVRVRECASTSVRCACPHLRYAVSVSGDSSPLPIHTGIGESLALLAYGIFLLKNHDIGSRAHSSSRRKISLCGFLMIIGSYPSVPISFLSTRYRK